jgi:hypothetical protein
MSYGGPEKLSPRPLEQILAVRLPAPLAFRRSGLAQRRIIPPSNSALRIGVEEDPKPVRSLNARYADAACDGGLASADRETLLDIVGNRTTGNVWPRIGDMSATRRYMAGPRPATDKAGWCVHFFAVV